MTAGIGTGYVAKMDTRHRLTDYRKKAGLSLQAFAAKVGATKSAVWKWETRVVIPRKETMRRIVKATGGAVMVADFFEAKTADEREDAA